MIDLDAKLGVSTQEATLPDGWVEARLGDGLVVDVQPGFACGRYDRDTTGVPHLRPMNVNSDGGIDLVDTKYVPHREVDREERRLRAGDVLFNNTNSPELVGKTAHYDLSEPRAFSNHMTRIRCQAEVLDSRFCALVLHQLWREGYFLSVCNNHVSQASVSRAVLLETRIPLPSLAEQHRIVAAVRGLAVHVNRARERLDRVLAILQRFRQAVLAAACTGGLTDEWRSATRKAIAPGVQSSFSTSDMSHLEAEDLPASWTWMPFATLLRDLQNGISPKPKIDPPGTPVLRISAVRLGAVSLNDCRYLSSADKYIPDFCVEDGDLLFTRYNGSLDLLGVCGMVRGLGRKRLLYPDKLIRARLDEAFAAPAYVELFFASPGARERLTARAKSSAGQQGISGKDLRAQPVALPPLPEQREILSRVEALFSLADAVERRVQAATVRANRMTQAILAKAFRGELVPTEAELARRREHEPATVLGKLSGGRT